MEKITSLLLSILLLTGCASFPHNEPLTELNRPDAYTFNNVMAEEGPLGETFIAVTLSGGGTRAGALAYGVLKHLDEVELSEGESLLDKVNVISSVSGGSFASAYYGLYGKEKFFSDFKKDFLYSKLGARIFFSLFRIVHWGPVLFSSKLGRSEIAQKMYDHKFFKKHTFRDMPRKWPFIVINATEAA